MDTGQSGVKWVFLPLMAKHGPHSSIRALPGICLPRLVQNPCKIIRKHLSHAGGLEEARDKSIFHVGLLLLCPVVPEPLDPPWSPHANESGWGLVRNPPAAGTWASGLLDSARRAKWCRQLPKPGTKCTRALAGWWMSKAQIKHLVVQSIPFV